MNKNKTERIKFFLEKYKSNLEACTICPHQCGIDRNKALGRCKEPYLPRISSFNLHLGEEPPLSGEKGSGTIFFAGCNMNCCYCQNFPISQLRKANTEHSIEELADNMITLQRRGAHNINFVTPSHYLYQIVSALDRAYQKGLSIPLVYNTSGYDRADVIRDMEGILDIYLPDIKYVTPELSKKYSGVENYFEYDSAVLKEMYRQTEGRLVLDENGIAQKGLIIRHLVLPNNVDNSIGALKWIKENLSNQVFIGIMSQYFPAYRVSEKYLPEINEPLSLKDYEIVLDYAESLGFENAWFQE